VREEFAVAWTAIAEELDGRCIEKCRNSLLILEAFDMLQHIVDEVLVARRGDAFGRWFHLTGSEEDSLFDGVPKETWMVLEEWYTDEMAQLLAKGLAPVGIIDSQLPGMVFELLLVDTLNGQTLQDIQRTGLEASVETLPESDLGGSGGFENNLILNSPWYKFGTLGGMVGGDRLSLWRHFDGEDSGLRWMGCGV